MNVSVCFWLKLETCNICMANRVTPMRGSLSAQHADACSIQLPNFAVQRYSNNVVAPQKNKSTWNPPPKKNPMVCRCMSSFRRGHVSVQAVLFQDIIILFIQVLESVAAAGAPGGGPPKETQPLWEINPGHFDEAVTELILSDLSTV